MICYVAALLHIVLLLFIDGFSPLVGYPKWKVSDVVQQKVSLSEDAKVEYRTSRTQEIQVGGKVNNGAVPNSRLLTSPGPAHRYK